MMYDNRTKCMAIMDKECKIGIFRRNFSGEPEQEQQVEEEVQRVQPDNEEIPDALDSDNFEMNDLEGIDFDMEEPSQK